MKAIALDTNVIIAILNKDTYWIDQLKIFEEVYVPSIVAGEVLFGAKNSGKAVENLKNARTFLNRCHPIEVGYNVAETYAELRLFLKKLGRPIPENDLWIAATCKTKNLKLLTRDKHFTHFKDLTYNL